MMAANKKAPWYLDAIFYELYIRAYRDQDGDGHGDMQGMIEKLDYVQELGVDCIWILPMYPSPLKDDGYDVADYYNIHEQYGTLNDFDELIDEAHKRGLRVITDLVVNHTSDQHPWFIESRGSKDNPKRDWYVWSDNDQLYRDARIIFLDTEDSNWTYDAITEEYYWHRFYSSQPDLNFDNPEVQQAMLDIIAFWLDRGIDGFRVDAVPYLYQREGTNCENLPETHDYLRKMRQFVSEHWPDALLLCEANQMPEDVVDYFGEGDEFHMAFHFPVMPRIYMALRSGDTSKIREIMETTPEIPDGCQWCTFLRNHDELTLEMVSQEERQWMWQEYAPDPRMKLNLGIRRRLAPLLDNRIEKIMLANRVLFSLPGAPIVYYGDEIGMGDNIWLPDRNGVRTPMQWDNGLNAGFSAAPPDALYAPVIDDEEFGFEKINVVQQEQGKDTILNRMRDLIRLKKKYPVLATGELAFLETGDPSLLAFIREGDGVQFVVIHNFAEDERSTALDLSAFMGFVPTDVLTGYQWSEVDDTPYELTLSGYDSAWLLMEVP